MILDDHGITIDVPPGWDARIFRRPESTVVAPGIVDPARPGVPRSGWTAPVAHLGNFALPEDRGDYGSGAVNVMLARHVFIALVEFGSESVGTAMFRASGLPRLRPVDFDPNAMQRPLPGMGGVQRFLVSHDRAFCLYAVVGSMRRRATLTPLVNRGIAAIGIASRG